MKTLVLANRKLTLWAKSVPSAGKAQRLEWRGRENSCGSDWKEPSVPAALLPPTPHLPTLRSIARRSYYSGCLCYRAKNQDGKFFSGPTMHVILTSSVCLCVSVAVWVDICWKRTTERWKIKKKLHSAFCNYIYWGVWLSIHFLLIPKTSRKDGYCCQQAEVSNKTLPQI